MALSVLAGLIAAVIGVVVWGATTYYTGWELGLVAWLIGLLVGSAMLLTSDRSASPIRGGIGVAIAALAILGGKFAVLTMLEADWKAEYNDALRMNLEKDVEYVMTYVADKAFRADPERWRDADWPHGRYVEGDERTDYAPELWTHTVEQWNAMTPDEQRANIDALHDMLAEHRTPYELAAESYVHSFSLWDLLWLGFAMFSAYKLAHGEGES